MKRAKQNTNVDAARERLLLHARDQAASAGPDGASAAVAVAVMMATAGAGVAELEQTELSREALEGTCRRLHRGSVGDESIGEPVLMQELVTPLHDIRYATEYSCSAAVGTTAAAAAAAATCRVMCRRHHRRHGSGGSGLHGAVARAAGAGEGAVRSPEVLLTDASLLDEIRRVMGDLDRHLATQHGAQLRSVQCVPDPAHCLACVCSSGRPR
jgi:hypothetical protein